MIRRAELDDISTISRIHEAAFPGFFLSELGVNFLRWYYRALVEHEDCVFLVYENQGVEAFVCGISEASAFNRRFLLRHIPLIMLSAARAAIRNPSIIPRIASRPGDISHFPVDPDTICLLSIAVSPARMARGVGSSLINEFIKACVGMGYSRVYLTTDRGSENKANAFYRKNGFLHFGDYNSGNGRILSEYYRDL
jgi:ribosomal protein S18 acetylase RimI-like enzyme